MSLLSVVYCKVDFSATGRSLVQRSRTESGVSECDLETSTMTPPRAQWGCRVTKKKKENHPSTRSTDVHINTGCARNFLPLWYRKVHYRVHKLPPFNHFQNQLLNTVHGSHLYLMYIFRNVRKITYSDC